METPVLRQSFFNKHFWLILGLLLIIGFVSKTIRLGTPPKMYFDEVYHAFTAQKFLENDPEVNNPFALHPEGFAYEWTHPHLGKWLIAVSIKIFGNNGIGWRFSSVFFGTLIIFLATIFVLKLFNSKTMALLTAFFLSIEGLIFTMSRVAMIDIHFLGFALLTFIMYWHWKEKPEKVSYLLLTGVAFGFAAATKWTAAFVIIILTIDLSLSFLKGFRLPIKNWFFWFGLSFVFIPGAIYLMSYVQMFLQGYNLGDFVELQRQMWVYHSHLKDTHSYSSKPIQWIFDLRPVWFFAGYPENGKEAHIYNLGNPIILWSGISAVLYSLKLLARKWDPKLGFLLSAYFLFWIPWCFSPRIQFFHHYTSAVLFLCIILSYVLLNRPKVKAGHNYLLINLCLCSFLWFIIFFPHLTAIPMPKWFIQMVYFALPGWK